MDFSTWASCYTVYCAVLHMLRFEGADGLPRPVATLASLDYYGKAFRKVVREAPEAWHLCVQSEDPGRAEPFPRLRRRLSHGEGVPWADVFVAAADEDGFGDREVRKPALQFLTRG